MADLLTVAKGCLGYFQYMADQHSDLTPDDAWLAPLREAIQRAEVGEIASMPLVGAFPQSPAIRFVGVGSSVMRGGETIATARSKTMAKRIANALNNHVPNSEGV